MPSICHAWKRRAEVDLPEVGVVALLSLPDLVQAKKTQRDKDWPMIRRLVEVHYLQNRAGPNPRQVRFWLTECRTAPLLIELAKVFPDEFRKLAKKRPLLAPALTGNIAAVEEGLLAEEQAERTADRQYWAPLRKELQQWRRQRP